MSTVYDAEGKTGQGPGEIKEEYRYQQWDMVASPGLKCTFISSTFLSKLLMVFWVYTYFGKNILRISKILTLIGFAYSVVIQNNYF